MTKTGPQSEVNHPASAVAARCIDHVNLSVRDLHVSVDFYSRLLGIEIRSGAEGR